MDLQKPWSWAAALVTLVTLVTLGAASAWAEEGVVGLWQEKQMTIGNNTCGTHPVAAIEAGHPYYLIEGADETTVKVYDCGRTESCETRKRLLGTAQVQGDSLRVFFEKPAAPLAGFDCAEQDTITVELFFGERRAQRTLTNRLFGSGCGAYLEAHPGEAVLGGCAVEISCSLERVQG